MYATTLGTLATSDGNSGNHYTLTFVSNDFEIKKRAIEVDSRSADQDVGDSDPVFTYQITSGALAFSDSFVEASAAKSKPGA